MDLKVIEKNILFLRISKLIVSIKAISYLDYYKQNETEVVRYTYKPTPVSGQAGASGRGDT